MLPQQTTDAVGRPLSPRCLQMRALRLALQLARSEAWCASCTAAGGVACSLNLAGLLGPGSTDNSSSGASVQLSALHLLARLVQAHQLAAAAVGAHRQQVLDSLMGVLLSAGSARPVTPAAAGASKAKGPSTPDATKQVRHVLHIRSASLSESLPVQLAPSATIMSMLHE